MYLQTGHWRADFLAVWMTGTAGSGTPASPGGRLLTTALLTTRSSDLTWHQPTRDCVDQVSRARAMQPVRLTLKGFRGIRDGLGSDTLTLYFERLADGAQLIAIAGANGRGKTTVMEQHAPLLDHAFARGGGRARWLLVLRPCVPARERVGPDLGTRRPQLPFAGGGPPQRPAQDRSLPVRAGRAWRVEDRSFKRTFSLGWGGDWVAGPMARGSERGRCG